MPHHFTLVFHSIPHSVDAITLATAMVTRAPPNAGDLSNLGLTVVTDVPTATTPIEATRTLTLSSSGLGPLPDVPFSPGHPSPLGAYLQQWLTSTIEQAVSNPVTVDPIVEV
jgi:hypothetical protein